MERSQGLFDPSFPTYTKALIMSGMTLALLILLGAKVECAKKFCCLSVKSQGELFVESGGRVHREDTAEIRVWCHFPWSTFVAIAMTR